MTTQQQLSIGAFAQRTRLSHKALRLYDEQGLLRPAAVDPYTRYRTYLPSQIERGLLIASMRRMEMPLQRIRAILDALDDAGAGSGAGVAGPGAGGGDVQVGGPDSQARASALMLFEDWWQAEESRRAKRDGLKAYIRYRISGQGGMLMEVLTRTVPARTIAVLGAEVNQSELDDFIMSAFTNLFDYAQRHAGIRPIETTVEWPTYAIFHGQVTPDQSSLVEVAIVVDASAQPEGAIAIRVEPEHLEAYVAVTKDGLEFPGILEAYDAAYEWVGAHGVPSATMPSREVYVTDVLAAVGDDHVADVAVPYTPHA